MTRDWEAVLTSLKVGSSHGRPAAHKPLLVLLLVARARAGGSSRVGYAEIAPSLEAALKKYGSSSTKPNAALPFLHLEGDGFWKVHDDAAADQAAATERGQRRSAVRTTGEFDGDAWQALQTSPGLAERVTEKLLAKFFPAESHAAIREGLLKA